MSESYRRNIESPLPPGSQSIARAVIALMLVLSGCEPSKVSPAPLSNADDGGSRLEAVDTSATDSRDSDIRAGLGSKTCHVGAPIGLFQNGWESQEAGWTDGYLINRGLGVEMAYKDGKVTHVFFNYLSRDRYMSRYSGMTNRGVSHSSDMEDILSKHGTPSYIMKSRQSEIGEFPGKVENEIAYVEDGISFMLIEGRLALISVFAPDKELDYEAMEEYMRDQLLFIRPRDQRKR